MRPSSSRRLRGSARPVIVGLIVILATAAVLFAYGLLTRQKPGGPPQPPPRPATATPVPSTGARPTATVPAPPPEKRSPGAAEPAAPKDALFFDGFAARDPFASGKWIATRDGDFKEAVVDAVGGRLRIRVGTIGTRDDTVKHLGLRTAQPVVDLTQGPIELSAEIDWNDQANGCYLQASLFLCPTSTDGSAGSEKDWLKFEYIGVPPGRNARAALWRRQAGSLRFLYDEGWPKQKTGRPIGKQQVTLRLDRDVIEIIENGKSLFGPEAHGCIFQQAYLCLEVSSHSNYPPREVYFDTVLLRPGRPGQ